LGSGEDGERRERRRAKPAKRAAPEISERDARKSAANFEKEQKRREAEVRREGAARRRDRERREKATAIAQAALDKTERVHAKKSAAIQAKIDAIEKRSGPRTPGGEGRGNGCKRRCGAREVTGSFRCTNWLVPSPCSPPPASCGDNAGEGLGFCPIEPMFEWSSSVGVATMPFRPRDLADRMARQRDAPDGFLRETFSLPREEARAKAKAFLKAYPKAAYMTEVERWRELPGGAIEFTMRRLRTAD
jgi:hypothetical protein